ncbi:hypothetical protein GUJ93_ZPchr0012g20461 [Zizania palustris]|uniref:Trichome birefringence-like N-terminal domain-containing protein n=1 Tax=Zizania palustris TaxID=103762 RepID=A0A8J6BUW7_ZIZPA|nr:hypothetical protein GUJ93_ZPchr0012g20461 [Zizania palustris]
MQRRKPPSTVAPTVAKQPAPRRTPGPLSFAGLLLSVLLVATFLYNHDDAKHAKHAKHCKVNSFSGDAARPGQGNSSSGSSSVHKATASLRGCDLYKGQWVYDTAGSQAPLYREAECEFLTEKVTCMRNGRRDDSYQRWRWQPDGCDFLRFEARALLERLRNKRLMFVGDSLNRNQWESMVCLVQYAIPRGHKTLTKFVNNRSLNVFRAHEYNATVEFYWASFLVQSNSDDPRRRARGRGAGGGKISGRRVEARSWGGGRRWRAPEGAL